MFGTLVIIFVGVLTAMTDVTRAEPRVRPAGIKVYKTAMAWEDAHRTCYRAETVLASPITDKALHAMRSLMGVKNTRYFIGIKSTDFIGPFVSVEGVPLEEISMDAMDMIDVIDQRDGDCLAMNNDDIRAVSCSTLLPFMCYNTSIFNMIKIDCGPDEGYKYNESLGSCYKKHTEKKNWGDAEQTCVLEGGHLIVIDNESEARFAMDMMREEFWTGLHDLGNGDWISVHGTPVEELYNVWNGGAKPHITQYRCSPFWYKGHGWNTCNYNVPFVCEKSATYYPAGDHPGSLPDHLPGSYYS